MLGNVKQNLLPHAAATETKGTAPLGAYDNRIRKRGRAPSPISFRVFRSTLRFQIQGGGLWPRPLQMQVIINFSYFYERININYSLPSRAVKMHPLICYRSKNLSPSTVHRKSHPYEFTARTGDIEPQGTEATQVAQRSCSWDDHHPACPACASAAGTGGRTGLGSLSIELLGLPPRHAHGQWRVLSLSLARSQ